MRRWQRVLLTVLYWLAVLVVSVALLVALVLLIESRDQSSVNDHGDTRSPTSLANTTIRFDAL